MARSNAHTGSTMRSSIAFSRGVVVDDTAILNAKLREWEHFHNFDRPHAALNGQPHTSSCVRKPDSQCQPGPSVEHGRLPGILFEPCSSYRHLTCARPSSRPRTGTPRRAGSAARGTPAGVADRPTDRACGRGAAWLYKGGHGTTAAISGVRTRART